MEIFAVQRDLPSTYPLSYFYSRETTTYLSIKTGIGSIKCNSNQLTKTEQEIQGNTNLWQGNKNQCCSQTLLKVPIKAYGSEAPSILLISLISNIDYISWIINMKKSSRTSKIFFRLHPKFSSCSRHKLLDACKLEKNLGYTHRYFHVLTLPSKLIDVRN